MWPCICKSMFVYTWHCIYNHKSMYGIAQLLALCSLWANHDNVTTVATVSCISPGQSQQCSDVAGNLVMWMQETPFRAPASQLPRSGAEGTGIRLRPLYLRRGQISCYCLLIFSPCKWLLREVLIGCAHDHLRDKDNIKFPETNDKT